MLNLNYFTAAAAALTLVSGVNAGGYPVQMIGRNQEPSQPSCTNFTPYVYRGCYADLSNPRALLFSGPSNQNMTVETCVAFCKGNDYKFAGLEYYNECFCGASVNGPQVDESYCSYPCSGDKSEVCGGNDYINIYMDTTFPTVDDTTISDYQPMGCYSEGSNGRSLAWRQDQLSQTNLTVEECLFACKDGGYSFGGVEFGQECYCGVVLGNGTTSVDSSQCNIACTGNSSEICGGSSTLDLYVAKDLESTEPCKGGSSSSSSSPPTSSSTPVPSSTSSSATTTSTPSTSSTPTPSSSSTPAPSSSSTPKPSSSSTPAPSSSSAPPTTTSSTTVKPSLCTSTYTVTPTPSSCEYKCGKWCSTPIPTWNDKNSCMSAVSSCEVQLASCFLNAGFPDSLNCFSFSSWCSSISNYCGNYCPGGSCSKYGCTSKYPPSGTTPTPPTLSTSVYTCHAASTSSTKPSTTSSSAPTRTSCVPIPTNSNICSQPHNPSKGYSSTSPVGNIPLPCLTCNNVYSEYKSGNCFKLYTYADTNKCPSYPRTKPGQGCQDACDSQYSSCMNTYAQGCKSNGWKRGGSDTYSSASMKCKNQWNDCYNTNSGVNADSRCNSWNSGWY